MCQEVVYQDQSPPTPCVRCNGNIGRRTFTTAQLPEDWISRRNGCPGIATHVGRVVQLAASGRWPPKRRHHLVSYHVGDEVADSSAVLEPSRGKSNHGAAALRHWFHGNGRRAVRVDEDKTSQSSEHARLLWTTVSLPVATEAEYYIGDLACDDGLLTIPAADSNPIREK